MIYEPAGVVVCVCVWSHLTSVCPEILSHTHSVGNGDPKIWVFSEAT